ncbi:BglG family transcription antiterminator [Clostridium tertium]|uniref:BglG family transcription antiterminator n=1 Tax=Clostridium tertium TaxID=1559 RepID=UPI001AEB3E7C|nr:BglG family transcription antiterminator [Clostridium tertium]MBP1868694.1 lichenan operon transcriptional antiterminator [Clostridium tertium]
MRNRKILEQLFNSDTYLNLDYFADFFKVSTKTISNNMKYLIKDGKSNGFDIRLKRARGYYIEINNKDAFNSYIEKISFNETFSPEYRTSYIIVLLLLNREFITMDYLAEKISVSKSIIKSDMRKVELELESRNITLERKAHYGIKIQCDDYTRKKFILMYYEDGNEFINNYIENGLKERNFKVIENKLIELLKENSLNTNYIELEQINSFIKITICIHNEVYNNYFNYEKEKSTYFRVADELSNTIEEIYDIKLNKNEILDLKKYLIKKTKKFTNNEIYIEELRKDIERFVQEIDCEYDTNFYEDEEFKKNLLYHISLLINRLQKETSFSNPLVKEISIKYPTIFDIAIKFSNEIEGKYKISISQDEIGFIATHFAAHLEKEIYNKIRNYNKIAIICSSGKGSALLMKLKLEMLFSSSDIRTYSLLEEDEVDNFNPDIIFTNWQLSREFKMPVVYVDELIDDLDILRIRNIIKMKRTSNSFIKTNKEFMNLFKKETFRVVTKNNNYMELLEEMAKEVEALGYVDENYASYIIEREEYMSTIYDNGVAIPHPINICGKDNLLSVAIIKNNNFTHNKKPVKIIFMVALEKGNMDYLGMVTQILFEIMKDEYLVEKLRGSETFEDFLINLNEINI